MRFDSLRLLSSSVAALVLFSTGALQAVAAPAPTTTTLTITSGGSAVSSVASGSMVTLTAAVVSNTNPLTTGQVNFCDAAATYCTDIHLLATAQLTSAGTAVFNFHPGIGSHSYKAVFAGTPNGTPAYAGSASAASALTVTGTFPTTTAIAASGSAGNYTLKATVTGNINGSGLAAPTGTVSFLDATDGNASLGTSTLGTETEALSFLNSSNPPTGDDQAEISNPNGVWMADFNGDGTPDIAITNNFNSTVTILLGKGDGTFTEVANTPDYSQFNELAIAVGDFNGDGIPDLAVANRGYETLTILLGKGDGTFMPTANSPLYMGLTMDTPAMVAGDFNGDGIVDLAVTSFDNVGTVTVLLGKGDGTFLPTEVSSLAGSYPTPVAVGDFNGDGIPDLVVTNASPASGVTILLGNGDGTFSASSDSPISFPNGASGEAIGDFNGDGKVDLAVVNGGEPGSVTILLGNGDGTFAQAGGSPISMSAAWSVSLGDFNGDGIPDLAIPNGGASGAITILLGNGDGTFTQPASSPAPAINTDELAVVGDFNGDGLSDLFVVSIWYEPAYVMLSQLTQTATATATSISPVGTGTHQVEASYSGNSLYGSSISTTTGLTAVGTVANLTSPAPNSVLTGSSVTFAWTVAGHASGYSLWLGSTGVGSSNLYNSHETTATSVTASALPTNGETIYARLYTITNGVSTSVDYTYTAATQSPAAITSPTPGSTLTGSSVTFTWTPATGATGYSLWIGSTGTGSSNLYDSHTTTATSVTVSGLPTNGETIYVQLNVITGGASTHSDYTYTAATLATLSSPTPRSTLSSSSATFTWTAATGATGYSLWIGSTGVGSDNLYNSHETAATWVTATGLPTNGETIYVRLNTIKNGASTSIDYTYTAATLAPVAITSPAPGSTLTGSSATFTWTPAAGATGYSLWIGSTGAASSNLYNSHETAATSVTATGLPTNGETIYVQLNVITGGASTHVNYTYTAQ